MLRVGVLGVVVVASAGCGRIGFEISSGDGGKTTDGTMVDTAPAPFTPGTWARVDVGVMDSTNNLWSVWGSAANDVWIGGNSGLDHWDGAGLTRTSFPTTAIGMWGFGQQDVWIAGLDGMAYHWDGASWTPSSTGASRLEGIWGSSSSDVWVCGWGGTLAHWDGAGWSMSTPLTSDPLWAVAGSGPNDVWAVGGITPTKVALHWDGTSWTDVTSILPSSTSALWAVAADDIWANAGSAGLSHWNGTTWSAYSPSIGTVAAFSGTSASDIWAVGNPGLLAHWNGATWTVIPSGETVPLNAVWTNGPETWVPGSLGILLHRTSP